MTKDQAERIIKTYIQETNPDFSGVSLSLLPMVCYFSSPLAIVTNQNN